MAVKCTGIVTAQCHSMIMMASGKIPNNRVGENEEPDSARYKVPGALPAFD
jgi:hypothetical protein